MEAINSVLLVRVGGSVLYQSEFSSRSSPGNIDAGT
jgi:hypothetical protein